MTPVFADTYFWLALINPRDGEGEPTNIVITETIDTLKTDAKIADEQFKLPSGK